MYPEMADEIPPARYFFDIRKIVIAENNRFSEIAVVQSMQIEISVSIYEKVSWYLRYEHRGLQIWVP